MSSVGWGPVNAVFQSVVKMFKFVNPLEKLEIKKKENVISFYICFDKAFGHVCVDYKPVEQPTTNHSTQNIFFIIIIFKLCCALTVLFSLCPTLYYS